MSDADEGGKVYLWLCCEGWVRFGPFPWLRFDDERGAILDDTGRAIAIRIGDGWQTPDSHQGYCWSNPTVTASPRHPHPHSGSPPDRPVRKSRRRLAPVAASLLDYFRGPFQERLRGLHTQRPNEIVLDKIMQDPDAVFFGGPDWERCRQDLDGIPAGERARFVLCLFVLVLLDQHVYTSFRPLHAGFRSRHRVPKFGWSGFGPHNENPFKLLVVPVREGLIRLDDLAAAAPEAATLLAEEVAGLLAGTQNPSSDEFYRRLYADPGFGQFAEEPPVRVVVGALDAVLAGRGIDPRQ
jgi:hypothetical protein